ncbi:MAG: hypothetical protein K6E64_03845 [Lachnospiraceae bacterium]|nr:hypothetical protein [Lachnospiraceae bacterium]
MKKKTNFRKFIYGLLVATLVLCALPMVNTSVEAASKPKITSFTESNVNTGTKMKVTFKASGTKSYKVWVSTKKSSGFKKISYKKKDTGKNETYTIKKCGSAKIKENKTYYVKVTIYSKKNYKGTKVTKTYKVYSAPTTAKLSVSKTTTSGATISWKKVSGATKYQVKLNGKTYTQKGLSKAYTNLGANTNYTVMVRSYKQIKVNGKTVKLYSVWKTIDFATAKQTTTGNSTTTPVVKTDVNTTYGAWQNIKSTATVRQSAENEKRTEDTDVYNGVNIQVCENCGRIFCGNQASSTPNHCDVCHPIAYGFGCYKIGTLTTETTPVYNVTTEDMSEAYRTVTTVTYYSDGTSKTSSTTQRYVDVYGTTLRTTSTLADESEWEVNYTYRINQYYAELFDYENGEPIDTGGGYGLFKMNGDWYFGNLSDYTKFPSNDNVILE